MTNTFEFDLSAVEAVEETIIENGTVMMCHFNGKGMVSVCVHHSEKCSFAQNYYVTTLDGLTAARAFLSNDHLCAVAVIEGSDLGMVKNTKAAMKALGFVAYYFKK